jgi:hypothetical protein
MSEAGHSATEKNARGSTFLSPILGTLRSRRVRRFPAPKNFLSWQREIF